MEVAFSRWSNFHGYIMEILTLPIQAASPTAAVALDAAGTTPVLPGSGMLAGVFADLLALQLGLSSEAGPTDVAADKSQDALDTDDGQELPIAADAASLIGLMVQGADLPLVIVPPGLVPAAGTPGALHRQMALPELPSQAASVAVGVRPESPADAGTQPALPAAAAVPQNPPLPSTTATSLQSETSLQPEVPRQALAVAPAAIAATAVSEPDALPVQLPDSASKVAEQVVPAQTSALGPAAAPATHAAAAPGGAQTAQPSAVIAQPVASQAWGGALGDRVVWMLGQQHQGVELHLNPAALGPLEVRLSISDGQANLSFATQHVPVREAIEAATPRLREMLADSGISLGSVSVNVGSFTQSPPGEQAQRQSPTWAGLPPVSDFSSLLPVAVTVLGHKGMVDIFA